MKITRTKVISACCVGIAAALCALYYLLNVDLISHQTVVKEEGLIPPSLPEIYETAPRNPLRDPKIEGRAPDSAFFQAQRLVQSDFKQAIAIIVGAFDEPERSLNLSRLAKVYCTSNPGDLPEFLNSMTDREIRNVTFQTVASEFARTKPSEVANFFELQLGSQESTNAWQHALIESLAQSGNAKQASTLLGRMAYSKKRIDAIRTIARTWGENSVDDVLEWVRALEIREDKSEAMQAVFANILTQKGSDFLLSECNASNDPSLIKMAVNVSINDLIAKRKTTEIQAFIDRIDPKLRNNAQLAEILLNESLPFAEGISKIAKIDDQQMRTSAKSALLNRELRSNALNATNYFKSVSVDEQLGMVSQFTSTWYDLDSIALSDWINGIAVGKVKDESLVILALRLSGSDKNAANQVASAISNEQRRRSTLEAVGRQ